MARIHIFGASGSGTTTLAKSLSDVLRWKHLDTDDYFWASTDPPFQKPRLPSERIRLLMPKLESNDDWILSGSLCGWGDVFIPKFDLAIFMWVPSDIRMERLRIREEERYGDHIIIGGRMNVSHHAFMKWASEYDDGDLTMRSRSRHEEWMKSLPCEVMRLEGEITIEDEVKEVMAHIGYF